MKRIITYFSLVLSLLCCFFYTGNLSAQQSSSSHARVSKIEIVPKFLPQGTEFDQKSLLSRLKTKGGCVFSQTDFDEDLKALALEFDRVEPVVDFTDDCVSIHIELWLKPTIRNICWKGNCKIDTKSLIEELAITSGSIYEHYTFNEAFHKIKAMYVKKGYFEAEINFRISQVPGTNEIDIEVLICEGRAGKIKNICFEGFTKKEENEILDCMITKEYCIYTSWFDEKGIYNEAALEQDRMNILEMLQNEGYADARVEIFIANCPKDDAIDIKIVAHRGELYYFGDITINGHTLFPCERIYDFICAYKGQAFSPEKIRESVRAIQALYGSKGYIETVVFHRSQLQPCNNTYSVNFEIEEGEQFRVGLIKVFGNTITNTRVILHESLLVPGEIFDSRKLKATECRLEMIGYFKCVNVYPVKSSLDQQICGNFRDVHIEVEETTTGNIGVFFGYSTVERLFGGIELTENNFNHEGLFSLFSKGPAGLRGNGEYLQIRTSLGTKATTYCLRWAQPYFMDTQWVVGFDLERGFNRAVSRDYDIDTIGFKIHATYPFNHFLRYNLYYRYQNSTVHVKGDQPANIQAQEKKGGAVSAVGHSLCYDSTDSPCMPTRGFRSHLSVECAGLGGHFNFLNLSYINTYYHPVCSRGTLKFRLDAKFIQPVRGTRATDIPLAERFFLGGEDTVRGYRPYIIGPQFSSGDPTGGVSSFLISEEYLHRIFDRLHGFVFFDAGSIALNTFQIGPLRASYGTGIRVEVMNGIPVILGMGWPVNPKSRSDVKKFFISIGGRF